MSKTYHYFLNLIVLDLHSPKNFGTNLFPDLEADAQDIKLIDPQTFFYQLIPQQWYAYIKFLFCGIPYMYNYKNYINEDEIVLFYTLKMKL